MGRIVTVTVIVGALVASGCSAPTSEEEALVFDDSGGRADEAVPAPPRPYGTWTRELGGDEDGFYSLTLTETRRFHSLQRLVRCEPGQCVDELGGRYRFASSHGRRYVVTYNGDDWWYSFEYVLEGDELRLRETSGDTWIVLHRAGDAWCELPEDCAAQGLEACGDAAFRCAENVCRADCGVDEETCQGYETAIDDCVGLHGMRQGECIDDLGGEPIRALLRSCCAADGLYMFCPVDRPQPTGFLIPLLDENDGSLLALRNPAITAGGFDPLPEAALITGDGPGAADFQIWQSTVEDIDRAVDLGTSLLSYGNPSDYRAERADGTLVELCYVGPVEGVPNAMAALTDNVFSDQLTVYGWKFGDVVGYGDGVELDAIEGWFPAEWESYRPTGREILVVTDSSDGGDSPSADVIPPCS